MTSARLKPMLFTSIWTSSAPGGGTSRFSIFSTLASPYSWKRTMRAMISPLLFCDLRNHQTMPQIHFAFEHLGQRPWEWLHVRQFEMRRKIRMCLPVDETGNALSIFISCLLFGRETHASTTQSDPLLLPTRNGPCREDGALHWEYLS